MVNIGYARVSSTDQDFNGQIDRLKAAGCKRIFAEKASGISTNGRHQLDKAVRALQPGDTLVTVRLDRLARSIRDLLHLLDQVKAAGARFRALDDPWCDTTTPQGELILTVMGGVPVGNLRSDILVMQPAQNRHRQRATDSLDATWDRRVLVQR
jgi:DNA invertase Pin-like site-specific DNA recombinase